MTRSLALVLMFVTLPAFAQEIDRKQLKPGLITAYQRTRERPTGSTSFQLEPTVALYLKPGEAPTPRGQIDDVFWRGTLQIVTAGAYTFSANHQGGTVGVSLRRNEKSVVALEVPKLKKGEQPNYIEESRELVGKPVMLEPGVYRFQAYFQSTGQARVKESRFELLWQGPGFRKEPIPHYFLGHLPEERKDTIEKFLPSDHGRFLFEEHGCKNCHTAKKDEANLLVNRTGPDLSEIGKRVYTGWLDAWLADPSKHRPNTTMPKLFAEDDKGVAERYAVVQYLASLGGPMVEPKLPTVSQEWTRSIAAGTKLFTATGCAACHGKQLAGTAKKSEDDDDTTAKLDVAGQFHGFGTSTGAQSLYALGAIGSKTRPDELQKYLLDPMKTNPHGRMPNMQLTDTEARDLSRFLIRATDESFERTKLKEPKLKPSELDAKSWKEAGEKLMTTKGCVNCHTVAPGGKALVAKLDFPEKAKMGRTGGCIAEKPDAKKAPVYQFDADRRASLTAFIAGHTDTRNGDSPLYQARTALKRFNCLNCHIRDGEGGIGSELADQMKKLESAENADDVSPPRLTGIGHKAKTSWLESVLLNNGRARPWMSLRMPQYGAQNVGHLPATLAHLEGTTPDNSAKKLELTQANVEAGRKLNGSDGLGCIKCHDISGHVGGGTRGPDLARTSERLRYDWYERWMHNPQRMAPGTKMPQNFNNGKSAFDKILGGDAEPQIDAIWAYLSLGPGLPLPIGMEPPKGLILKGGERPEILRTFMPDGAGTKAIAVGFNGSSYVFDAHACRIAYAWEGNFLDASPLWNNRGGNPAKLLGPKFFTPPAGQPWAITASRTAPDVEKNAKDFAFGAVVPNDQIYQGPRHVQFEGYSLDDAGMPSFRYIIREPNEKGEMHVKETATPAKASVATGLTRSFEVEISGTKTPWLLAGETKGEPRVISPNGLALPVNLKDADPEAPAIGAKLVLPDGARATVITVAKSPLGSVWRFVAKPGGGWLAMLRLPESRGKEKAEVTFTAWSAPKDDAAIIRAIGK